MTSMRRLRRRLLRWQRYAIATGWTTGWSRLIRSRPLAVWWSYSAEPSQRTYARRNHLLLGLVQAAAAVNAEEERRFWAETPEVWLGGPEGEAALVADVLAGCDVCGLPDLHHGQGDGIGSCDCPRCDCGTARGSSLCSCDPACSHCLSTTCEGDCDEAFADEPDDDAGHGDDWPPRVVTEQAFAERGLL